MKKGFMAIVCTCLLLPAVVSADNNMRDYIAAPQRLLSLLYHYHITGNTLYVAGEKAGEVDFAESSLFGGKSTILMWVHCWPMLR